MFLQTLFWRTYNMTSPVDPILPANTSPVTPPFTPRPGQGRSNSVQATFSDFSKKDSHTTSNPDNLTDHEISVLPTSVTPKNIEGLPSIKEALLRHLSGEKTATDWVREIDEAGTNRTEKLVVFSQNPQYFATFSYFVERLHKLDYLLAAYSGTSEGFKSLRKSMTDRLNSRFKASERIDPAAVLDVIADWLREQELTPPPPPPVDKEFKFARLARKPVTPPGGMFDIDPEGPIDLGPESD